MRSLPGWRCTASRFGLVLLLAAITCGCQQQVKNAKTKTFTCGDQQVSVDPTDGTIPKAVYVCEGDTVTWEPNNHQFEVAFKKGSPFVDGGTQFDNGKKKSAKTKHHDKITVYEYDITVDGKPVNDPQVVAGGGTP